MRQPSREEILDSLLPEVDQASAGVKEALRLFGSFGYGSKLYHQGTCFSRNPFWVLIFDPPGCLGLAGQIASSTL